MQERAYATVGWIHRVLAWTFAVVGLLFLLAPNGTVRTINAVGSIFVVFPPAPESELRFWLSLGFAYMVLVTALAWRIADDPRARRDLMPILAAGKFASSITCLLFFAFNRPTFLYLLNFLVDGSIVLLVLGCYLWLGALEQAARRAAQPTGHVAVLLELVTETMAPEGGAFPLGACTPKLRQSVWNYFAQLHPLGTLGLTAMLYAIEWGPYVFGPQRRRFSELRPTERDTYLVGWEHSRLAFRRQLLNGLKLAIMLHFYDAPDVCTQVGYDGGYLRNKLLAGPNALAHQARLEAGGEPAAAHDR